MPNSIFSWVHREANSVAHYLAKFAVKSECFSCFKKDSLPPKKLDLEMIMLLIRDV